MAAITAITPTLEFQNRDTAAWVDISAYLMSWQVRWGRRGPFDNMRARTLTCVLLNTDRRFDCGYGPGAYYPGEIEQGSQLSLKLAVVGADTTTKYLFMGQAEKLTLRYPGKRDDSSATCTVEASDPMSVLASEETDATIASDDADDMLLDVLAEAVWTTVFTGVAGTACSRKLQAVTGSRTSLLSLAQQIAFSDWLTFWIEPGNKNCAAYLYRPWAEFSSALTLAGTDLYDIQLGVESDSLATIVSLTAQVNNVGAATFDVTDGIDEDQWTLNSHPFSTGQEVWFTAVGTGAEPFVVDTSYWVYKLGANRFHLCATETDSATDVEIEGTGSDSSGTWMICSAGKERTSSSTAAAEKTGERRWSASGLLLKTDAEVSERAVDERERRSAQLRGKLRPTSVTVRIAKGSSDTNIAGQLALLGTFSGITISFDPGTGAARDYEVYTQGGIAQMRPGGPLEITAFTEIAGQWEV